MPASAVRLDRFYDPGRFAEIARLHQRAFAWQPQGRIPLGIHVVDPSHARGLDYDAWLDPEPFLEFQTCVLADTLAVGSDLLPAVAINHLGDALITSLFGAGQLVPEAGSATLQDVGPTPLPVFSDIGQVENLSPPPLDGGIIPAVERIVRRYREVLPAWVHVVAPMPSGPFSTAMELRGSDLLYDLTDAPALAARLIDLCARLIWEAEARLRGLIGSPPDMHVTNFGILGPGLRLGEDSIVNLSPEMIRRFCLPAVARINHLCGGRGHIHFCSLPDSRFPHIYPVLAEAPEVAVVSSQFGFETYAGRLEALRGRLAVESFYGDAYRCVCERYGSFRAWAREFVARYKEESGLVLYTQVSSVDEGRDVWEAWQEAHRMSRAYALSENHVAIQGVRSRKLTTCAAAREVGRIGNSRQKGEG
jgi:hypothetical protein